MTCYWAFSYSLILVQMFTGSVQCNTVLALKATTLRYCVYFVMSGRHSRQLAVANKIIANTRDYHTNLVTRITARHHYTFAYPINIHTPEEAVCPG